MIRRLLPAAAAGRVAHTVIGPVPLDLAAHGVGTVPWRPESLAVRSIARGGDGVCTGVELVRRSSTRGPESRSDRPRP